MLLQHGILSVKANDFLGRINPIEEKREAGHPLRLELNSYIWSQSIAGPMSLKWRGAVHRLNLGSSRVDSLASAPELPDCFLALPFSTDNVLSPFITPH